MPVTTSEVQGSPIPALSIISDVEVKPPVKPNPPPEKKPAVVRPMWMPHRNPVRNINTSTR